MSIKKWLAAFLTITLLFAPVFGTISQPNVRAAQPDQPNAVRIFIPLIIKFYGYVPSGQFTFASKRNDKHWEIYSMKADGSAQTRLTNTDVASDCYGPRWSPDGTQIIFYADATALGNFDIFRMNADGSHLLNITSHTGTDAYPSWSPDGKWIAFASDRSGDFDIYIMRKDGSDLTQLTTHVSDETYPAWSPDGSRIAFVSTRNDSQGDIYVINVDGSGETRLTSDPEKQTEPAWSPDSSRIAYTSYQGGINHDIFVMYANGSDPVDLTAASPYDESSPHWSPDGTYLSFTSGRDAASSNTAQIFILNINTGVVTQITQSNTSNNDADWHQ